MPDPRSERTIPSTGHSPAGPRSTAAGPLRLGLMVTAGLAGVALALSLAALVRPHAGCLALRLSAVEVREGAMEHVFALGDGHRMTLRQARDRPLLPGTRQTAGAERRNAAMVGQVFSLCQRGGLVTLRPAEGTHDAGLAGYGLGGVRG